MRVNLSLISFKAKILKHEQAIKYNEKWRCYSPKTVYLARINPYSENELGSVAQAVKDWNGSKDFAERLIFDAIFHKDLNDQRYYVLTTQKNDLENLNSKEILGVAETAKVSKRVRELKYIQVHPEYAFNKGSTEYINLGKSIVKGLQKLNKNRAIKAEAVSSSKGFYESMGFKLIDPLKLIYMWKRVK